MIVSAAIFSATILLAQEKAPEAKETKQGNPEAVIIPVKTLSGDSFNRLAKMLGVFGVRYVADDKLRTILVYAPPDVVKQIRRVVEELDRPGSEAAIGHNIEMTYGVSAMQCEAAAGIERATAGPRGSGPSTARGDSVQAH